MTMASACAPNGPGAWQKPDADTAATERDTAACQSFAEQEASRRYPAGFSSPSFGAAAVVTSQQFDDTHRATLRIASFNACMQDRGYRRATPVQ